MSKLDDAITTYQRKLDALLKIRELLEEFPNLFADLAAHPQPAIRTRRFRPGTVLHKVAQSFIKSSNKWASMRTIMFATGLSRNELSKPMYKAKKASVFQTDTIDNVVVWRISPAVFDSLK